MDIHGVTVCVDYSDFLSLTAPENTLVLASHTVVTSSKDTFTQNLCKQLGMHCIVSDLHRSNMASFNKAKMLNVGLKYIYTAYPNSWIACLDADTYFKIYIPLDNLDSTCMYGAKRMLLETPLDYLALSAPLEDFVGDQPLCIMGYFQLFSKHGIFFDENYTTAECCDHVFFYSNFPHNNGKDFSPKQVCCFHLGQRYTNWRGRLTTPWNVNLIKQRKAYVG